MSMMRQKRTYHGHGTLTIEDGDQILCAFECVQLPDARIVCHCIVEGAENEHFNKAQKAATESSDAKRLEGQTDRGLNLEVHRLTQGRTPVDPQWTTDESYILLSFLAREMRVSASSKPYSRGLVRFGLTNLEFLGTDSYTKQRPNGTQIDCLQLPFTIAGQQVTIRPLEDYRARVNAVKATKSVDVTSEAIIEVDSLDTRTEAPKLMDDLCLLLSLARGCRVQWIHYDLLSPEGEIVESYYRDAVTKPYSPLMLIAVNPPEDTKSFVEKTFDRFREQKERWELQKAIEIYIDAKLTQDSLELRGLKLAVLMEFLKGCYSRWREVRPVETPLFQHLMRLQAREVWRSFKKCFCGGNEVPFRKTLQVMRSDLSLDIGGDLGRFVRNRNKLVHRGRFTSTNSWQEYSFMMTLVGKVLLAILGYDGYYYDWTKPPGGVGWDVEMRVKLGLEPSTRGNR